jgi:hypothetical protein
VNDHDLRRLLEDMGREAPPPPDADFVDQLEFQLRAEVIASSPSPAWAGAPWRIPFGIAAAAFTVVVGIAGASVLVDLPDSQVSAQLASVTGTGTEVIYPNGKVLPAHEGMTIPEGSVVRVRDGGTAVVDGVPLEGGQAVKVTDAGLLHVDFDNPTGNSDQVVASNGSDEAGSAEQVFDFVLPPTPENRTPSTDPSATTSSTVGPTNASDRISQMPLGPVGPPQSTRRAPPTTIAVTPTTEAPAQPVAQPPAILVPDTVIESPTTVLPPSTDTTTSTTAEPPATTETTVPPAAVSEEPPPPGGTTTTTEPHIDPSGGTDPGRDPGGTVEPAGSTGEDQQAIDDGLDPAGDADQTAAGDTGTSAADDAGAQDGGGGSDDPAGDTTDATVEV